MSIQDLAGIPIIVNENVPRDEVLVTPGPTHAAYVACSRFMAIELKHRLAQPVDHAAWLDDILAEIERRASERQWTYLQNYLEWSEMREILRRIP